MKVGQGRSQFRLVSQSPGPFWFFPPALYAVNTEGSPTEAELFDKWKNTNREIPTHHAHDLKIDYYIWLSVLFCDFV